MEETPDMSNASLNGDRPASEDTTDFLCCKTLSWAVKHGSFENAINSEKKAIMITREGRQEVTYCPFCGTKLEPYLED